MKYCMGILLLFGGALFMCNRQEPPGTVADRVRQYGEKARARLHPFFARAGVWYPPAHVVLVFGKNSQQLHLYAGTDEKHMQWIRTYSVLAASGDVGPKLREGDKQVPEGVYKVESLNPNSRFHLSLRVNYPNDWDRAQAHKEGRTRLGGDIMIHGGARSIGCIAIGDEAIEEVFVLAAETNVSGWKLLLSPCDREGLCFERLLPQPVWMKSVYEQLRKELSLLPVPGQTFAENR